MNVVPISWQLWITYRCAIGKAPNLKVPKLFNEKLSWIKLHDHNPLYTKMVDKYDAKAYVTSIIGVEYVVPCYGIWDSFEEIDFNILPSKFILKVTHDSSGIIACKDKSQLNMTETRSVMTNSLNTCYYFNGFEWPYKDVKPRILADELLDDGRDGELQDYKWWCFSGKPKVMYITNKGIAGQVYENFYDMEFRPLNIDHGFPRMQPEYRKPKEFEKMRQLAERLSEGIPFVRVDFFDINGKIYFGEFTFFDHAGLRPFGSNDWEIKLGDWIRLPFEK